ncbi:hypothetical protein [Robertmurraya mangrovi]|nr:hypothetical protein [Bacillus sp. 31A1R]
MQKTISILEKQLEETLITLEQKNNFELALNSYREIENELLSLIESNTDDVKDISRVLAQVYLRQAGMLRQLGHMEEANKVHLKELDYAKLSENSIAHAQSLFSSAIHLLSNRQMEEGLSILEEAKSAFEKGETDDHKQGVGWYWIILADLGNKKLINVSSAEIVDFCNKALEILVPLNNKPGVSRAYEARAAAGKL